MAAAGERAQIRNGCGYSGVNVGGSLYDVAFVDGTCVTLFSGCDSTADFDFDAVTSNVAAQALLDQVFGNNDAFDTNPPLTAGCTTTNEGFCQVIIPNFLNLDINIVSGSGVRNLSGNLVDLLFGTILFRDADTGGSQFSSFVYADFSPAAAPVPEPASLLLLGTGLAGLVARARHKRGQQIQ